MLQPLAALMPSFQILCKCTLINFILVSSRPVSGFALICCLTAMGKYLFILPMSLFQTELVADGPKCSDAEKLLVSYKFLEQNRL